MSSSVATYPLDMPLYCTHCGYDQRGLPLDSLCPECGASQAALAARINRWADLAVVDLWSVAMLQAMALVFGLAGWGLVALGHLSAVVVAAPSLLCVGLASGWYVRIAVGFLRRRSSVNYRNLTRWRRRQLARWLILDLSLAGGPPLLWFRGVWF